MAAFSRDFSPRPGKGGGNRGSINRGGPACESASAAQGRGGALQRGIGGRKQGPQERGVPVIPVSHFSGNSRVKGGSRQIRQAFRRGPKGGPPCHTRGRFPDKGSKTRRRRLCLGHWQGGSGGLGENLPAQRPGNPAGITAVEMVISLLQGTDGGGGRPQPRQRYSSRPGSAQASGTACCKLS